MNRMATKAIILSEIDIDEEYTKLDPAVINDISPDNYLGCKAGFADPAKILSILNSHEFVSPLQFQI